MAKIKETEEQPADLENVEEAQPTEEVKDETQTLEGLQAQLATAKEQYDNLYKESQRRVSSVDEQKRQLVDRTQHLESIPSLQQKLEDQGEYIETIAALLEQRLGASDMGQTYMEQPPMPRSPFADLRQRQEERRKQPSEPKKEPESKVDPEDLRASVLAQGLIEDMGWDMEHPSVKKTLHLDDPKKALEILKKEVKAQRDREAEETVQAKLKEAGVTTPETASPSGASLDDDTFIKEYSEGKRDDHERAKKILNMK